VTRRPDSADRRQVIVELTKRGREVLAEERRRRQDWLSKAIAEELTASEQEILVQAIDLLRRVADL
jgi:DNA-binding MarR family transcriptional regulator